MKIGPTNIKILYKKKGKKLEKLIDDKFSHKIDENGEQIFPCKSL